MKWFKNLFGKEQANINAPCLGKPGKHGDAKAWAIRGHEYRQQGTAYKKVALKCFDIAISLDSNFSLAWVMKGQVFYYLYHYQEALTCFEQAVLLDKVDADAWCGKAECEDALGQKDRALISYQKFLSLDTSDTAFDIEDIRSRVAKIKSGEPDAEREEFYKKATLKAEPIDLSLSFEEILAEANSVADKFESFLKTATKRKVGEVSL